MKDAVKEVLNWAAQSGKNVTILAAKNIDSVISQVVYTVEGMRDIVIGEFDGDELTEITLSQDLIEKITSKNIWKD